MLSPLLSPLMFPLMFPVMHPFLHCVHADRKKRPSTMKHIEDYPPVGQGEVAPRSMAYRRKERAEAVARAKSSG